MLGLGGWFLGVLITTTAIPGVALNDELLATLAIGVPIGLAVFLVLCLPFGPMWADWVRTVVNSRGGGLLYSILEAPMLALPLVAWIGRRSTA